jgi:phage protein D
MPTRIDLRRRAFCQIVIDNVDVTHEYEPHLISVVVIDAQSQTDTCSIELDDRDGKLPIPEDNKPILVRLGWAGSGPSPNVVMARGGGGAGELAWEGGGLKRVFWGGVSSVESGFARRGGGRRLWIEGTSGNLRDQGKEVMRKTWGDGDLQDHLQRALGGEAASGGLGTSGAGTGSVSGSIPSFGQTNQQKGGKGTPLETVLREAAKAAGYKLEISPLLAQVTRDFWHQNSSFHSFGEQLARELGGAFKIKGDTAYMNSTNDGKNILGEDAGEIDATWGFNLISWRIKPFTTRPDYKKSKSNWYDLFEGAWKSVENNIGAQAPFGRGNAALSLPSPAPNRQVGEQLNGGSASDSAALRGTGWVVINGEPEAASLKLLKVVGARPGVDGQYKIKEAEHHYTRNGGYTTRCILDRPGALDGYEKQLPVPPMSAGQ